MDPIFDPRKTVWTWGFRTSEAGRWLFQTENKMHSLRRHFTRTTSFFRRSFPNAASAESIPSSRLLSTRSPRGGDRGRGRGRISSPYGDSNTDEDDNNDSRSSTRPRGGRSDNANAIFPDPGWGGGSEADSFSSWSTGLTKDHFDGSFVGRPTDPSNPSPAASESSLPGFPTPEGSGWEMEIGKEKRKARVFVDSWEDRWKDTCSLLKQVREPGTRGELLKEEEKKEMCRLHKEDPEKYDVERLAKTFRVMRQRVHAVLWLKELEEDEEKRSGKPLDDSIERLIDACPEFFVSHDKDFHVASLPYKPDFKVMPVDWDGTTKDPDEVLYEISMKEDEMLYREFVENINFNKKKIAGEVFHHKYSRRRPQKGWNITFEKLGPRDKCRSGSAFRFVSLPNGSSRELTELEKMYARRETPRRRRKILP